MKCRSCGGGSFGEVIDLGSMPLANNLLSTRDQEAARWPLKVVFCRTCTLAQLTDAPPPPSMFDEYLYFSAQSQTMVEHAGRLVERYVRRGQRVFEIASNDGYLLKQAQERGADVYGIDPARNIAATANRNGVPTMCQYFNVATARQARAEWGEADVIFANNVLAHVPDPNEIAAGIAEVLSDGGVAHIEVPYIVRMIESRAFDTIYHEHQCYFSLTALRPLFNRHGLKIADVDVVPIHGGSLHFQVARSGDEAKAGRMIAEEHDAGLWRDEYYADFAREVGQLKEELAASLQPFERVVGYGAAAKGVVLLNTFRLDCNQVKWVADVSPYKQGKFIPGTRQEIVSPARLLEEKPDAALLLPWNIEDEILRRNREYLNQGGRFVVPIPRVRIVP